MAHVRQCEVDADLLASIKAFKMRKDRNIGALVLKIDEEGHRVVLDKKYEDITVDDLRNELPENQPRYVLLSYLYQQDDGRVSYPQMCIFCSPTWCEPVQQMMYTGSKIEVVKQAGATRCYEIRDRNELTEEFVLTCADR